MKFIHHSAYWSPFTTAPFKEKNYVSPLTQKVHCLVELLQFFADFLCEKQFHTIFFVDFRALVQFCAVHQGLVFEGLLSKIKNLKNAT